MEFTSSGLFYKAGLSDISMIFYSCRYVLPYKFIKENSFEEKYFNLMNWQKIDWRKIF